MTNTNKLQAQPIQSAALIKHLLIGGGIGLAVMMLFISGADGNPAWGEYWKVRPLVCATLGGAGGGLFFYLIGHLLGSQGGWKKIAAVVIGLLGFIIALYLGSVFGMAGTLWN